MSFFYVLVWNLKPEIGAVLGGPRTPAIEKLIG